MDPEAEKTLVRFFAPYNARLIKLLGFDPGWAKPGEELGSDAQTGSSSDSQ